ncbi:MAG: LytTR family DNA-binding domain-containing protein [Polaribacter sp.]
MNRKYPFDPSLKHHFIIAFGLAIWVFLFLYFTEPLDINELTDTDKLIYLPLYGLLCTFCYSLFLPIQYILYKKNDKQWFLKTEILFLVIFLITGVFAARFFYLYVVVAGQPNPYTFYYHLTAIILPAFAIIFPIVILGRFAFGKYKDKKLEDLKIEIKGEGNYEGLRLFLNDVICIQSSDNYIEVFYLSGNDLKKTLIRNKLSVIADEFPELLRTHRSYLINPYHFLQWKTANSKLFIIATHHIKVPVSRTYQNDVKAVLNSTTE